MSDDPALFHRKPLSDWTPYIVLYVDTGADRVLVDMGSSASWTQENLAAEGIQPSGIDTVVITHPHPDHVGGMLDDEVWR